MIIQALIEKLSKLDPNTEVYVARDEEGNGFEPLHDIDMSFWDPKQEEMFSGTDVDVPEMDRETLQEVLVIWP